MKELIKKYKKIIIIFSFAYIYLLFILLAPTNYIVLTPGELTNVSSNYKIENSLFDNDINTISVYSWNRVTVLQKWLTEKNSRYTLRKKSEVDMDLSIGDRNLQGKISLLSSHNNALITAYTYANMKDSNITIDYELKGFTVYESNHPDLKIGDLITNINNKSITSNSYEDYLTNLDLFSQSNIFINKSFTVKIDDSNLLIEDNNYIVYYPKYEIKSSNPTYTNFKDKASVGGPSGGMIQTLAIYSALLGIKYNFKISGTGTINLDNDFSVGKIGGIKQKYITAKEAKSSVFIVPNSQVNELSSVIKPKDKIEVIGVNSFDDLLENFINNNGRLKK